MPDSQRLNRRQRGSPLRLATKRAEVRSDGGRASEQREAQLDAWAELAPDLVEVRVRLDGEQGLIEARRQGRQLATRGGFKVTDQAIIAAIVSELGRNILLYAAHGEIVIGLVKEDARIGVVISASDTGPGIANVARALRDGYSTSGRPGIGLPGVRRLSDEFSIACRPQGGTNVVVRKWRN